MSEIQLNLDLPEPHFRQREILDNKARFRVAVCGRRFGKTLLGEHAILYHAINLRHACWWLAPTYDMADHVWRELKTAVRGVPGVQISESDLRMDFAGGGWIAIHSTHVPDHLRGAGLDFVVLDEAAFMTPDIWPVIVRPMLVEKRGGALFLSSPNGKNWFHDLYLRGLNTSSTALNITQLDQSESSTFVGAQHVAPQPAAPSHPFAQPESTDLRRDAIYRVRFPSEQTTEENESPDLRRGEPACDRRESPWDSPAFSTSSPPLHEVGRGQGEGWQNDWRSFHFPTSANPLISPDELASIRAETVERIWLEEYGAEFTDSTGQVFRGIREAATAPLDAQPDPNVRYAVGLDWGREDDYTAIVVMDSATKQVVAMDRFNQVNWSLQRGRLKAICDRWQPVVIWAESNSIGAPNIEALQIEGLPVRPFNTNASTKSPLIEALSLAIERRDIALIPDETLLGELAAYRMERLPAGGYRYSAPPGLHDDTVIALALAWYAANHSSLPISFA